MKTIILLFTIIISISLFSCKKCATCKQITITDVTPTTTGYPQMTETTFDACGKDLKDVNGKTVTSTSSQGNIKVTITTKTTCQ